MVEAKSEDKSPQEPYRDPYLFFIGAGIFLTSVIGALCHYYAKTDALYSYLIAISLSTIAICGLDKQIARTSGARVPEVVLLGMALVGGSAGLIFGMKFFRHKTQSPQFQFFLALVLLAQFFAWRYREKIFAILE